MVDKNKTEIVCVLDRSGSMASIWKDMIGGLNSFIKEQKEQPGEANITLVVFDTKFDLLASSEDIKDFNLMEAMGDIRPRGMTALHDAIGMTINSLGRQLSNMKEEDRPGNVIFSIVTDGYENASKESNLETINKMITHQQEKYSWVFTYLGANQDSFEVGQELGLLNCFCSDIDDLSSDGVRAVYSSVSHAVSRCRSTGAEGYTAAAACGAAESLDEIYKQKKNETSTSDSN